jgi:hypothetical protein
MKKTILNAALLMAATLSVPLAANAVTLTYSYNDVANSRHFEGTFEGALASDNNTFVVDSTSPGTGGYWDFSNTYQSWSLGLLSSFDYVALALVGALPTVTLDGTYMDIFAFGGGDKLWAAAAGNSFMALYTIVPIVALGAQTSSFSAANWSASVGGASVSPVPEPETYALMLAGLGLVGFMARKRKAKAA